MPKVFVQAIAAGLHFLNIASLLIRSGIFNFYLRHFGSYPKFYGTMAGFIILMFWIYLASLILLIGAETDSVIRSHRVVRYPAS